VEGRGPGAALRRRGAVAAVPGRPGHVLQRPFYSRKSAVGHHNAIEVEEAGQAVRFRKKKAMARARAKAKAKAQEKAGTAGTNAPAGNNDGGAEPAADADANTTKETQR